MKIVIPNAIDLVSSTVPENDKAAWVQGQSYGEGAKVLRQHYIYESLQASNTSGPLSSSSGISAAWRKLINGMKSSGKKRDNSGSIGRLLGGMCNSIAEYATKKEGIQPSFFAVVSLTLVNPF